jgi:hypothetical protein
VNTTTYQPGKYRAQVVEQGFVESSNKGTPGFSIQIRILGHYAENGELVECPHYERTITQWLANDVGAAILGADLKAIGVQGAGIRELDPDNPNHVSLVGRQIDVTCTPEVYDGRTRERWTITRTRAALAHNAIQDLDDRFGDLLRAGGNGAAQPAAPVTAPNQTDTPF